MTITYGSVCSGIESASVAWEPLGMKPSWFSEIEKFPCQVLNHHWPHVSNLGDMTLLPDMMRRGKIEAPDILVGGTPCQAFSVAGKQLSMDDARGQLTLVYGDLLNAIDLYRWSIGKPPAIAVWENVPGVLSTKDNAFGWFLGLLAGEFTLADCLNGTAQPLDAGKKWSKSGCVIGPERTVAWRTLDAQYFGLAQRRKRVFVVTSARKGFDPAKVLFESEGLRRDTPPSRETGSVASALTARGVGTCGADDNQAQANHLISIPAQDPAHCTQTTCNDCSRADGFNMVIHGTQDPCVSDNLAFALGRNNGGENTVFSFYAKGDGGDGQKETTPTIRAGNSDSSHGNSGAWVGVTTKSGVRRLTPTECERLQGFPDGHTGIPGAADGNRYKALGNSKAVPVVQWVGRRIINEILTRR